MSTRERWIVYPLIFLTLGIALRDKLLYRVRTDDLVAERVECRTLIVHGPNGRPAAVVGVDEAKSGVMTVFEQSGKAITLGFINKNPGVFAFLPELKLLVPLTPQMDIKTKGNVPKPKDAIRNPAEPSANSEKSTSKSP
jgi:hypothetical protein